MTTELYVVRCSVVGPEPMADQMPLADAQRLADQYNHQAVGYCQGHHTVELASNPEVDQTEAV